MQIEKTFEVFRICIPVFCVIGFGKILSKKGFMKKIEGDFCTKLAYNFALPALIFSTLAKQPISTIFQSSILVNTIIPILSTALLFYILHFFFQIPQVKAPSFIYASFWGNTVYIGFPLCASAFGLDKGLSNAAIVNALCTPLFISGALLLIALFQHSEKNDTWRHFGKSITNPLMISIIAALITSYLLHFQHLSQSKSFFVVLLKNMSTVIDEFLKLIGTMGLALSLLAMGGQLSFASFKNDKTLLFCSIFGKLIVIPLITLVCIKIFTPHISRELSGVLILLAAMPEAVASFVISKQLNIGEDFLSAHIVLSTLFSVITIPLWLYGVL